MYEKIMELIIALTISSLTEVNPVVAFGTVDFVYLLFKAIRFLYLNHKKNPSDSWQDDDGCSSN